MPTKPNVWKSIVRSVTPFVIGAIVWCATFLGFHISIRTADAVGAIVGFGLTLVAHFLEIKWPAFGVFLGWLGAPSYTPILTKKKIIANLQNQLETLATSINAPVATAVTPQTPVAVVGGTFVPGALLNSETAPAPSPVAVVPQVPAPSPLATATVSSVSGVDVTPPPAA